MRIPDKLRKIHRRIFYYAYKTVYYLCWVPAVIIYLFMLMYFVYVVVEQSIKDGGKK